jgi:hypothetical protein
MRAFWRLPSAALFVSRPQVRRGIAAASIASAKRRLARSGAWSCLPEEELRAKLEAAEARRRALTLEMSPAQWALEERCARAGSALGLGNQPPDPL